MIVRGGPSPESVQTNVANFERCLSSFAAYPDEVVIVNTGLDETEPGFKEMNAVAERYGAKVYHYQWTEDFSEARNYSFMRCSHDIVMWLDADDIVETPETFANMIRDVFGSGTLEGIYAEYLYDFDDRGNCVTILNRERIVDRRFFLWQAPIHEVLCQTYQARLALMPPFIGRIRHNHVRGDKGQAASLARNLRVLEHNFGTGPGQLGKPIDERMLFYWANTLMGLRRYDEALQKYIAYVPLSGNQAEIAVALGSASECCRLMHRYGEAKALAYQAIERNPDAPTPYFLLAQAMQASGNSRLARHFTKLCLVRAQNFSQEMVSNPKVITGTASMLAAKCAFEVGDWDEALAFLDVAEKYHGPDEVGFKEMRRKVAEEKDRKKLLDSYLSIKRELESEGRGAEVHLLAEAAPESIRNHAEVARYRKKIRPAGKPVMVICAPGGMPGGWGPEKLLTGIGGSEEAICYMAPRFAKRGWHVEVYAHCTRQTTDGVEWYPFDEFQGDQDTGVDALIIWRFSDPMFTCGMKTKTAWFWAHDVPVKLGWYRGLWNLFDGMFFVSKYHSDLYGEFVPDPLRIVSANGIDHPSLVPLDDLANEPHRLVYASCPTRGLVTVLHWWEYIKKDVPDAELDVYYGLHPSLMASLRGGDGEVGLRKRAVEQVKEMSKQEGVNWKGFVGQEELHRGFAKAGVWAYPTHFPEVSCITAMKVQAHGCVPVTMNDFALVETVKHGIKINGNIRDPSVQKQWADAVIEQLKNPWTKAQRLDMARDARSKFNWDHVADQWDSIIRERAFQKVFTSDPAVVHEVKYKIIEKGNLAPIKAGI